MIRMFVFFIAWFGFGVIAAEIFNSFEILSHRINVLVIAVPIALIYLFSQILMEYLKNRAGKSRADEKRYLMVKKQYYLLLGFIGLFVFFIVPFVWWGVIEKLANLAGDGVRNF